MTAVQKQVASFMLLLSCAAAQNSAGTATVKNVTTTRQGSDMRVEVTLTAPVKPAVDTANSPDRILLDFPDTACGNSTKNVGVHANGVRRVRTGQHSTSPLITRVVIDLDQTHPYTLKTEGNRVILTIGAAENARNRSQGAPVAATSGNLIGVFRRKHDSPPPVVESSSEEPATPAPPPAVAGPAFEPPSDSSTAATLPVRRPSAVPQNQPAAPSSDNSAPQGSFDQNRIASTKAANADVSPSTFPSSTPVAAQPAPAKSNELSSAAVESAKPNESAVPAPPAVEPATSASAPAAASAGTATLIARSDDPSLRTVFKVKYVAEGVAYLDGGRAQGLTEGMKLEIEDSNLPAKQGDSANAADPRVVAELEVTAVADTSAVTDIHTPKRAVKVGDLAYLSSGDADALVQQRALSATRQYPAVISFTEGDTLDEEAREVVPRPPLPSVNRARGRIGFDMMETVSHGTTNVTSYDTGMAFRGDITRIGGTYWNLSGYWRGRITKESAASQQTLQSLINRTYHLNMTYDNPNSDLVAGFGRLYLPWAPSLDTIDGGYFGVRPRPGTVIGIFGGSTPDPSSWDYNPSQAIGGAFINFEGGQYDALHYSSTTGAGVAMVNWVINRPFLFFEENLSYRRDFAVYESAQLDSPRGNSVAPAPGPGLGRNFFTLRVNPLARVELDLNYNYFRDIPTFDATLLSVAPNLLDKFLFQGFSAGGRVEVLNQVWLSTQLGRSSRTGDSQSSLNETYGISVGRLPWRMRADAHYARFNSSFGTGSYDSLSLSRQMSDRLRLELLAGQQQFASMITNNNHARFLTGTIETTIGPHYYLQSNFTTNRGDLSYDQMMFSFGYRFDSKRRGE